MPAIALSPKELKSPPQINKEQFQPGHFSPAADSREVEFNKSLQPNPAPPENLAGIQVIFIGLHIQFWGLCFDDNGHSP